MSVYTQLSFDEIYQFAQQYALQAIDCNAILAGIENSNYFVHTASVAGTIVETKFNAEQTSQYVLTLFEHLNSEHANLMVSLLTHLQGNNIPVAVPLKAINNHYIQELKNKPAQLAPKLVGTHPTNPTVALLVNMGRMLANIHQVLRHDFLRPLLSPLLERSAQDSPLQWQQRAMQQLETFLPADRILLNDVFSRIKTIQLTQALPMGLIHGDLFRDNVLCVADEVTGVLDFSEISWQPLILDVAICINDFCSAWPNTTLDEAKYSAFLQGYQQVRALSINEFEVLPTYMALAACRFWLSRLQIKAQNETQNRSGDAIQHKDPLEMRNMLEARLAFR